MSRDKGTSVRGEMGQNIDRSLDLLEKDGGMSA